MGIFAAKGRRGVSAWLNRGEIKIFLQARIWRFYLARVQLFRTGATWRILSSVRKALAVSLDTSILTHAIHQEQTTKNNLSKQRHRDVRSVETLHTYAHYDDK